MADEKLNGIPDVEGLDQVVNELEAKKDEPKDDELKIDENGEIDLAQFKNPKDLLKGYKHIQAGFTRLSQENKALKEQIETSNNEPTPPVIDNVPGGDGGSFDESLIQDPEAAITDVVTNVIGRTRIAEVLENEAEENPEEFQERYGYVHMLSQNPQYKQYTTTAKGVKYLFQVADKQRSESLKRSAGKALESILGEPLGEETITRLKTLIKGNSTTTTQQGLGDAYMPDSASTKTGKNTDSETDFEAEINDAAGKGDVDSTIDAVFKQALT